MKNLKTTLVIFTLIIPALSFSQIAISFDTTNAKFISYSTDIKTRIVTIKIEANEAPKKSILGYRGASASYWFKAVGVEIRSDPATGKSVKMRPSEGLSRVNRMNLSIKKIRLSGNILTVEARIEEYFEMHQMSGSLPGENTIMETFTLYPKQDSDK